MGVKISNEAYFNMNVSKKNREIFLSIAKQLVWEDAVKEAERKVMLDIANDPNSHNEILNFCMDVVRPIVQSQCMGYGIQCTTDAMMLALYDMGWRNKRATDLLAAMAEKMEQMSEMIFQEHMEATRNEEETTDPYVAKAMIDAPLKEMYGESFKEWNERYITSADETRKSYLEYDERSRK